MQILTLCSDFQYLVVQVFWVIGHLVLRDNTAPEFQGGFNLATEITYFTQPPRIKENLFITAAHVSSK